MYTMSAAVQASAAGKSTMVDQSVSTPNIAGSEPSLARAWEAELTTRTSATVGTLTVEVGHDIETADIIEIYFSDGKRINVTVGTVSGQSVPFSLGSGDNLPALNSDVTVMAQVERPFPVAADDMGWLMAKAEARATIQIIDADGTTVLKQYDVETAQDGKVWSSASEEDNPLGTGVEALTVLMTHADASVARHVLCQAGIL